MPSRSASTPTLTGELFGDLKQPLQVLLCATKARLVEVGGLGIPITDVDRDFPPLGPFGNGVQPIVRGLFRRRLFDRGAQLRTR